VLVPAGQQVLFAEQALRRLVVQRRTAVLYDAECGLGEGVHVDVQRGGGHRRVPGAPVQRLIAARQLPQGGAQAAPGVLFGHFGPQRAGEDRAGDVSPQADERQQPLAVAAQFDGSGIAFQPELAEQPQLRRRCQRDRLAHQACVSVPP
jgi:hypothetical protein